MLLAFNWNLAVGGLKMSLSPFDRFLDYNATKSVPCVGQHDFQTLQVHHVQAFCHLRVPRAHEDDSSSIQIRCMVQKHLPCLCLLLNVIPTNLIRPVTLPPAHKARSSYPVQAMSMLYPSWYLCCPRVKKQETSK